MPTRGQAILIAASAIPIRKKNVRFVFFYWHVVLAIEAILDR